jgi:hypothetical protein
VAWDSALIKDIIPKLVPRPGLAPLGKHRSARKPFSVLKLWLTRYNTSYHLFTRITFPSSSTSHAYQQFHSAPS